MSSTETAADHGAERAFHTVEILELQTASKRLWARLLGGEDDPRIRARIDRVDALLLALSRDLSAMTGQPSVLAGQADTANH
ncbi:MULTISPECIES: hypothetical protein [unclassified Streptomyces]|uniref:Uncharacterized protein n=1 Tax=Streptomyces sp. NBC_00119 TaxID=2975659 RepID=A0AAU1UAE1_9ACTN|nr:MULTISPECIES: hypothetical protein [unclassified Streptomyces]MCX4644089.1 hypothetical protein [Streptomyces sp. NBC_01446]MCX5325201.1 hypothetical protein [Streptomyces sp. NBC_00120]